MFMYYAPLAGLRPTQPLSSSIRPGFQSLYLDSSKRLSVNIFGENLTLIVVAVVYICIQTTGNP